MADHVKTDNKSVMNNIAAINDAMSRHLDGEPHTPEKITFKYLKYSVCSYMPSNPEGTSVKRNSEVGKRC